MKKLIPSFSLIVICGTAAFAGEMSSGKDKTVAPEELFRAHEIQFGIFGAIGTGNTDFRDRTIRFREDRVVTRERTETFFGPNRQVLTRTVQERSVQSRTKSFKYRDHSQNGYGGGVETSYFLTNNFGVALEGTWLAGDTVVHAASGSLIYRYPIERGTWAVAPYVFGGGGGQWDGISVGFGHVGGGAELRFSPKWGLFADGRWIIHDDDVSYALIRTGLRLVF